MKSLKTSLELIKKLFSGNMKPSEKALLSEEEPMKQLLWEQMQQKSDIYLRDKVNPLEMWEHIIASCWKEQIVMKRKTSIARLYYLSAAVVALLLISMWIVNNLTNSYIKVVAPPSQKIALTLPDSSKVWLNAGSTLRYQKCFCNNRKVILEGEAFFDVEKKTHSPFRVYFSDAFVEVKGTEFGIKSTPVQASISLFSGKIDFVAEGKEKISMKPLECIIYTLEGQIIMKKTIDIEYDWRSDEYKFVDKPLEELIKFINEYYHVHLKMNNLLNEQYLFTGSIKKTETLTNVLEKICLTMELSYKIEGDSIVIY